MLVGERDNRDRRRDCLNQNVVVSIASMAASLERTTIASSLVFVFSFDGFDSLFIDF